MKYTKEELMEMRDAFHNAVNQYEANYNSDIDDRETIEQELNALDKLDTLLHNLIYDNK